MTVDYEWKSGLVFGIEADEIHLYEEETEKFHEQPVSAVYVHLGIVSVAFIFD